MTPAQAPVGRLLVCPTPIGNLGDVTLRVLEAIGQADLVACENTRHTRVLLRRHGLDARLISFHEHNERSRASELLGRMRSGALVALVCDAGTPLVSDPGFALVRTTLQAGIAIEVLPGPSAVLTALVASGIAMQRWQFVGFLPRKRSELAQLLAHATQTTVGFESPARLAATLALLASGEPERPVAVCRELTKLHEEVRRGSARELAAHYGPEAHAAGGVRGEVVLVIGAAAAGGMVLDDALAALGELVRAGARPRPAAAVVAKLTGLGANRLYRGLLDAER